MPKKKQPTTKMKLKKWSFKLDLKVKIETKQLMDEV